MEVIWIKPHHFMDIIKLYGAGIEQFVPDDIRGHDFYKVANKVIKNPHVILKLTLYGDEICQPCRFFQTTCQDTVDQTLTTSKHLYNRLLDQKIMKLYGLTKSQYIAQELCHIYYAHHEYIEQIWNTEELEKLKKRHDFFVKGAQKYLQKSFV